MPILTKATKTPGRVTAIEHGATYVVMTYNGFEGRYSDSEFEVVTSDEEARSLAGFNQDTP